MKRFFCLLLAAFLLVSLTACSTKNTNSVKDDASADPTTARSDTNPNETTKDEASSEPTTSNSDIYSEKSESGDNTIDYALTSCTKDSVDDFMAILGEVQLGGLYGDVKLDAEQCYNVTPPVVAELTDIQIFKFRNTCISLALIDGGIYPICEFFGGFGFVNAIPWDYDEDGNLDLLVASSWGSGLHRSIISVFNTTTKESIAVYDTSATANPSVDLIVMEGLPAFSSTAPGNIKDFPTQKIILTASIEINDNNLADLTCTPMFSVGSVVVENGIPVFKAIDQ